MARKASQGTRVDFTDPNYLNWKGKEGESDGTLMNLDIFQDLIVTCFKSLAYADPLKDDPSFDPKESGNGSFDNEVEGYELAEALGKFLSVETDWVEVTDFDDNNSQNSSSAYFNLQYRKKNGRVEVIGRMNNNTGNGFSLPETFSPSKLIENIAVNGVGEPLTISPSGFVYVPGGSLDGTVWNLNFSFPLL